VLVPGGDWRAAVLEIGPIKFMVGDLFGALLDFAIIALVIFLAVKFIMREDATQKR
jgi:large conductance mechanosensitive channel